MPSEPSSSIIKHDISAADLVGVAALREQTAAFKGMVNGVQARASYDQITEAAAPAVGVQYQTDAVGGVPGVWCRLPQAQAGAAVLYLHGGGYVVGSAWAYRHFAGQFAARSGVDLFAPNYRLAPEHPFPAALTDAAAAYEGLVQAGYRKIVVVGDSAGGGLALSLVAHIATRPQLTQSDLPVGCVVMSPWTDLALTGDSLRAHAADELYLTPAAVTGFAEQYLAGHSAHDPSASPLYGTLQGLPPLQIHVGTAEILLSDSLAYAARAQAAGASLSTHVWEGMPHVFPNCLGMLEAAEQAMQIMSDFIRTCVAE